jgi:hypothetical protein
VDERLAAGEIEGLREKDLAGLTRIFSLMNHERWVSAQESRGLHTGQAQKQI